MKTKSGEWFDHHKAVLFKKWLLSRELGMGDQLKEFKLMKRDLKKVPATAMYEVYHDVVKNSPVLKVDWRGYFVPPKEVANNFTETVMYFRVLIGEIYIRVINS